MAEQSRQQGGREAVLATVGRVVAAADGDTLYRDVYLRRAVDLLSPLVTEAHYEAAMTTREQLARLLGQARAGVARQDWSEVRELGTRAGDLQRSLDAEQDLLAAAQTVYEAPIVMLDPLSPGLTSPSKRWSSPAQARAETSAVLAALAREDSAASELYASRQRVLDALAIAGAPAPTAESGGGGPAGPATASVEQQALQALARGDAAALTSLAQSMLGASAPAARAGEQQAASVARARIVAPAVLAEPLPEAALAKAKTLGLEPIEAKFPSPGIAAAVGEFVERYAIGASAAVRERASDGVARVTVAAEELKIPGEVAEVFAQTISLFALHLYVNSAGLRYVPVPAPREALLLETHPEGDAAATPLLKALGLERRSGLARDDIEARLRTTGPQVLREQLGLDPLAFKIVCVPADVYMRVGRERDWGKREEWTHFDGYQVVPNGRLRALVGGNARFGGLFDFCSISRDDARANVVARFAVVRRERLGVRIG